MNRAGERLLNQPAEKLLNHTAEELGLAEFLEGEDQRTVARSFPGRRRPLGRPPQLVPRRRPAASTAGRRRSHAALREEELQAWQRLVRVLGHELNNSLAPIKSIAGSLESLLTRTPRAEDWEDDMRRGLSVIAARSEALSRFLGAYARLAKLPRPAFQTIQLAGWMSRVVSLETRLPPRLEPGPDAHRFRPTATSSNRC